MWNEDFVKQEDHRGIMPRAFLIASRRYRGNGEFDDSGREYSPEHGVRLAEYSCNRGQQPTSDGASECASEESSSECPEELYNLTKLAEVSLAAAAGTLVDPRHYHHQQQQQQQSYEPERTRLFFERIESERESLIELKTRTIERDDGLLEAARIDVGYADKFKPENAVLPPTPPATSPTTPTHEPKPQQSANVQSERADETSRANDPNHQQQDTSEEHECPDCGKRYSTSSNLARHRQTHRSLGDKKARRCPHCDKVYVSIPAFSMHVRTHNQGCKCHFCGKCFSRPWLLQGHIRTHTGEKPFKCTICNKAFADKSNLRAHIQTHSNTKPHVCNRCGKAFALKSYLYKHEESSCMRSHQQQPQQQKRESSSSPNQAAASPTSVIVPPRSFSSIIQYTSSSAPELQDCGKKKKKDETHPSASKDLLSKMVIRTSVISPNPEHIARFAAEKKVLQQQQQQQQQQQFDFNDPTRLSAFSRPQPMTLNLAIA